MRIKRFDLLPPGGWQFKQVETNWPVHPQIFFGNRSFDWVVEKIVEHRLANPRFAFQTDPKQVAKELELFTIHRIGFDPHYVSFDADEEVPQTQQVMMYESSSGCATCGKR